MTKWKVIANTLIITLTLIFILCSFAWVVSASSIGYSFVSLKRIVILGIKTPYLPFFDFKGVIELLINPIQLGKVFAKINLKAVIPFAVGAFVFLILQSFVGRIIRVYGNRTTTLHGSSRWATDKEMEKAGLLTGTGLVLGQTGEAEYIEVASKKPKKKPNESTEDFNTRLMRASSSEYKFLHEGEVLTQNSNAHTLVIGSTRSGKGISTIIPTEFKWPESIIIFDPKAEGWAVSSNFRSKFSYTFKFQPEKPKESIHYNPLMAIRRGTQTIPDIQNMAHILIPDNPQVKDPFWDNEGRRLLSSVIGYVIYCEPPKNKTFKYVYSIFSRAEELAEEDNQQDTAEETIEDASKESAQKEKKKSTMDGVNEEELTALKRFLYTYADRCIEYIEKVPIMDETTAEKFKNRNKLSLKDKLELEEFLNGYLTEEDKHSLETIKNDLIYFAGSPDQQLASVVSSMTTQLQVIADPNVQAITDRSDFVMEDFVQGVFDEDGRRHPMSLYLCVSLESMKRLVPLMRIIYEQAIMLLTREVKKNPYRLLLIFDEFYQMGNMEIVNKALALSAGYGILCCIAIQSFEQLRILYQSDAMFIDNFAYQVVLRVNDQSTCEKIEKTLGNSTKKHLKINSSGQMTQLTHKQESYDTQEMSRALMTAEEIRTMDDNDCIIIMSGKHAYKGKKIRYYMDKRFTQLYLDKKGNYLPLPTIDENWPHNTPIVDGKRQGIDDEGWHLIKGYREAIKAIKKTEAEAPTENSVYENGDDNNYITDELKEPFNDIPDEDNPIDDTEPLNYILPGADEDELAPVEPINENDEYSWDTKELESICKDQSFLSAHPKISNQLFILQKISEKKEPNMDIVPF